MPKAEWNEGKRFSDKSILRQSILIYFYRRLTKRSVWSKKRPRAESNRHLKETYKVNCHLTRTWQLNKNWDTGNMLMYFVQGDAMDFQALYKRALSLTRTCGSNGHKNLNVRRSGKRDMDWIMMMNMLEWQGWPSCWRRSVRWRQDSQLDPPHAASADQNHCKHSLHLQSDLLHTECTDCATIRWGNCTRHSQLPVRYILDDNIARKG